MRIVSLILIAVIYTVPVFSQQNIEDDFEGVGTINTWYGDDCDLDTSFTNPYQSGINTSAKVLRYGDIGELYANVRFDTGANFDLSVNNIFTLKIYVSSTDITGSQTNQISLKLQDGDLAQPWITQSEIIKPIVLDQWQEVTFDFANDAYMNLYPASEAPVNRTDFNRVLLQVNGENNTDRVVAYIDDFSYNGTLNIITDPVFDNLVWSDEFDGNGSINTSKWHHQTQLPNGTSWYNGETTALYKSCR